MTRSPTLGQRSSEPGYSRIQNPMISPLVVKANVTLVSGCKAALIRLSFLEIMGLYWAYFIDV